MDFLYWLQQLRNPILDFIFENISLVVNQTLLIGIVCFLYWCYDKKIAHKIFLSFCASGIAVQTLKIVCRIPRPWILDSRIQPKAKMIETATGYSFPSGHTQTATSACYSLLDVIKNKGIKTILIIFPILMMLSRMYVGVHSPLDVTVSFVLSSIIVYACIYFLNKDHDKNLVTMSFILILVSIFTFIYAYIITTNGTSEYELVADSVKQVGASIGFALGAILETKILQFEIKKRNVKQIFIVIVFGLIGALFMKSGLKFVLPEGIFSDGIRYFLTIFWIIYIYPCIMKKVDM